MQTWLLTLTGLGGCVLLGMMLSACAADQKAAGDDDADAVWAEARQRMIAVIEAQGVRDAGVLDAMSRIWRHRFIPEAYRQRRNPYGDHPAPIGFDQTISQPFIVAYMTEKMAVQPGEKVLEVGTGSGYQAAVLAAMGAEVYSIEIIPELAEHARQALAAEGYDNVRVRTGDGYRGWPEAAPFNVILVTCAPDDIPQPLVEQLAEGGRMIIPVGKGLQRLVILLKEQGHIRRTDDLSVRFVPMLSEPPPRD